MRPDMDLKRLSGSIARTWETSIVERLSAYVRIPNKSPLFDPQWESHGHMEAAVQLMAQWCRAQPLDRKSTRLNSSHLVISYAVFCLKKKILRISFPDLLGLLRHSHTNPALVMRLLATGLKALAASSAKVSCLLSARGAPSRHVRTDA